VLQHVHLVRHGHVENPQDVIYGNLPGFPLSEKGRAQATRMAAFLVKKTGGRAGLFSSPLLRARNTAEIARDAFKTSSEQSYELVIDERFTEGRTWREGLPRSFAPLRYARRALDADARKANEKARDIAVRMRAGVLHAVHSTPPEVHTVIMSHRFSIWMARAAFEHGLGGPAERIAVRAFPWLHARSDVELASVTTLILDGDRMRRIEYAEPAGDERLF